MLTVRHPAVAGSFYPGKAAELRAAVDRFIQTGAERHPAIELRPKAIIVPHAGYEYSGPVAGTAYAQLLPIADSIERVVLVGPSHFVGFPGLAASGADVFETPLGEMPIDVESVQRLVKLPQVHILEDAHATEHSLEVQLPFLQVSLGAGYRLIPLVVGVAESDEVAETLDSVWGGPETLIVVSSDLSHYHDYATAQQLDEETSTWIEELDADELNGQRACGFAGIRGLLQSTGRRGLCVTTLDVRNSGDTAGPRDQVVGYGAYVIHGQ